LALDLIKTAIDENRQPGQWLLSGSQNFALMQGISQTLSGRIAILNLLPFTLGESIGAGKQDYSIDEIISRVFSTGEHGSTAVSCTLDDWILRGIYPEIRAYPQVDRQLWCASYIQTYLERAVRQIVNVGDLNTFDRFLRVCAVRTGQILNLSEISRDMVLFSIDLLKTGSTLQRLFTGERPDKYRHIPVSGGANRRRAIPSASPVARRWRD
jgi:predicted AAA+ superfamily ATPase